MNTYKIRQRVPKALVPILNRQEIKKTFKTQRELDTFHLLISECVKIVSADLPLEVTTQIVLDKGLKQYIKQPKILTPIQTLDDVITLYLAHCKEVNTPNEYTRRVQFLTELLPTLWTYLNIPTDIKEVTPTHLYKLSKKLSSLANRKYPEYRNIPLDEYVKIKTDKVMLPQSVNKYIKLIRGMVNYGLKTGLYVLPTTIPTIKTTHKEDKNSREPFTAEEYTKLSKSLDEKARLLLDIVYYSGLRPSEIHKAKISTIDGVVCFNLKDSKEALKTHSSYRYVPIHSKLLPHIEQIQTLTYTTIRTISRRINLNGKTLYSARHSFVTNLINLGVPSERVSELVGHSHNTMTMSVYFKGYDLQMLREDVESL